FVSTNCPGACTLSTVQFGTAAAAPTRCSTSDTFPGITMSAKFPGIFDCCMSLNRSNSIGVCVVSAIARIPRPSSPNVPCPSPGSIPSTAARNSPASSVGCVSKRICPPSAITCAFCPPALCDSTSSAPRFGSSSLVLPEPAAAFMLNESSTATSNSLSLACTDLCRKNGRANASASNRTSSVLSANSSRYRSLLCRTELCVPCSKNISELTGRGTVVCFLSRCTYTGSPTASSPARNHGARKPITRLPVRRYVQTAAAKDTPSAPCPAACPSSAGDTPSPPPASCPASPPDGGPSSRDTASSHNPESLQAFGPSPGPPKSPAPSSPEKSPSDRARGTAPPRSHEIAAAQSPSQSSPAAHKNPRSPAQ